VSAVSFEHFGLKGSVRELRKLCYGELKARGFGAQAAQHVIKRVADSYTALRASIRAKNLGPEGSTRRRGAESKPVVFRSNAAHTYDDRCLSWNYDAQTVSIWTLDGRLKSVRFACSPAALHGGGREAAARLTGPAPISASSRPDCSPTCSPARSARSGTGHVDRNGDGATTGTSTTASACEIAPSTPADHADAPGKLQDPRHSQAQSNCMTPAWIGACSP
jgi:hypothetical protein